MEQWTSLLKKQFPNDHKVIIMQAKSAVNSDDSDIVQAIDEFMRLLKLTSKSSTVHGALKLAPLWLVRLALTTGLLSLLTNPFRPEYTRSIVTNQKTVFKSCDPC